MPILFLDFDGVLHDADAASFRFGGERIEVTGQGLFQKLPLIEDLLSRSKELAVVISSSWQHHFTVPELRQLLETVGSRVIGTTKSLAPKGLTASNRFEECKNVAEAFGEDYWVLLDDSIDTVFGSMSPPPTKKDRARVVFCDPEFGVRQADVDAVAGRVGLARRCA